MKLLAPCAALLLAAPLHAQNVWTVSQTGGADFFSPQAAVDAASDGDLIYVTGGAYEALAIDGKGVTLHATGIVTLASLGFFTPDTPALSVSNLAPHQTVFMRGFQIEQTGYFAGTSVRLADNQGAVVLEDCSIAGHGHPFECLRSDSVTLVDCEVTAPDGFVEVFKGDPVSLLSYDGIDVEDSNILLYDCSVQGGDGLSSGQTSPGSEHLAVDAGNALNLMGSSLFASGCDFTGGSGPDSFEPFCSPGSSGGGGVRIDSTSHADLLDCTTVGGSGGAGACDGPPGFNGFGIHPQIGGTFAEFPGPSRRGSLPSVAGAGDLFDVQLRGAPGDSVLVAISAGFSPAAPILGGLNHLHLQSGYELIALGALPASGKSSLSFFAPAIPSGSLAQVFATQFVFFDGAAFHEGGPTELMVLSSSL